MTKMVLIAEEVADLGRDPQPHQIEARYHFIYAVGFEDAVRILTEKDAHFDFLVTDIMLKPFLGRDLANRVVGALPGIKVLFMGKHPARLLRSTGLLPSSSKYLHKPFPPNQLILYLDEVGPKSLSWLDLILAQDEETSAST